MEGGGLGGGGGGGARVGVVMRHERYLWSRKLDVGNHEDTHEDTTRTNEPTQTRPPLLRKLQTPILTPQHPSTSSTATPPPMSLGVVVGVDEGATVEPGDVVEGTGVGVRVPMLMGGWTGGCWVERVYGLNLKVYGHVFTFPLTSEYMSMRDGQGPSRALKQTYNPIPWLC